VTEDEVAALQQQAMTEATKGEALKPTA